LYFQAYLTREAGLQRSARGVALTELERSYAAVRERVLEQLEDIPQGDLGSQDRQAIEIMRRSLAPDGQSAPDSSRLTHPCGTSIPAPFADNFDALSAHIYRCYGAQQSRVVFGPDTLDRLTILGRLASDTSPATRREVWLSLRPVWASVNGDNSSGSPYRHLVALSAARWRKEGSAIDAAATSLGLAASDVEGQLVKLLTAWRDHATDVEMEPWDWYFANGAASRRLAARVPRTELLRDTEAYFASFGASPESLGVGFDLDPRPGKTPVAFTQFGGVPRQRRDGPRGAEPTVVATYRAGGLGNLVELLHETGHAIHIAAIDTRPALADWPDSDPFTEALADVPALEAYSGAWQMKYLGDSATTRESLREKYGSIMLDVAWALFELRMHRDPSQDPNALWTDLTRGYLRIAPHPEWSWWAMRGQLVSSPGYMMNYALGALVTADIRARVRSERGGFLAGDRRLYEWLSDRLYKHGQSRPSRVVLADFLGRPVNAATIERELAAMRTGR
jgi:hypothetical protein